jgi:hypothetical protein
MNLILPEQYSSLRSELNEYAMLCNAYNYTPTKSEFDDIIRFILLLNNDSAGGSRLCESYEINPFPLMNHLYESFGFDQNDHIDFEISINEAGEGQTPYDPEKDTESATGLVIAGANQVVKGVKGAVSGVGTWIKYLFKKKKVKKAVDKEVQAELKKLQGYSKLSALKNKLSSLTGEPSTVKWPGMADSGSAK